MRFRTRLIGRAIAAGLIVVVAGCAAARPGSPAPSAVAGPTAGSEPDTIVWPAPPDPMQRAVQAGLKPQPKEFKTNHVHAHLDVFVDGKPVTVASGIGIRTDDPAVHRFDEPDGSVSYGGIDLCNDPCISPLHTHDVTGIIHTESATPEPNTLGELFTEWGVALDAACVSTFCTPATKVATYLNGELTTGDPRAIKLTDQLEIAIVIGTPPDEIPKTADFSKA